jgi:protein-tyrosine phosphatase
MTHILMLCLGNICRSPTAEAVTRRLATKRGVHLTLDSAGTGGWHAGEPPYGAMLRAARARGYDMGALRARQIVVEDFHRFDLILAMDRANLTEARAMQPAGALANVRLFLDMETGSNEVPDPYYTRDFDGCLRLIERGADTLLNQLADY